MIDLHTHTTESDGSYTPAELVRLAKEANLEAIAITDHDTCSGCAEALAEGQKIGIEVIPGIEFSTKYCKANSSIHILGYYIDPNATSIQNLLSKTREMRERRNHEVINLMIKDGLPVSYKDMKARFGEIIGRPHFGQILVELNIVSSISEAFQFYLNKNCRYYVKPDMISTWEAIIGIREAGGIPVLAHPFQYNLSDLVLQNLIIHGKSIGLKGIECIYSGYNSEKVNYLLSLAKKFNIASTGGSDFHGTPKPNIKLGNLNISYNYLENLRGY